MPQDPDLYGRRPVKKRKTEMAISGSLDFTAQLTSLMAEPSSSAAPNSTRSHRPDKESVFLAHGSGKKNTKSQQRSTSKLVLKDTRAEEEAAELERAKQKLGEKARLYAAMKRGDYVPKENEAAPLVDFDRKWAEAQAKGEADSGSDTDEEAGDDDEEDVEWEDEFGRLRRGTRAEKDRHERRLRRGLIGAEELERMSARPAAPEKLIYGDAIQTMAFAPDDPDKMEALARKRDRSLTPPDMTHYDADREIRDRGVGFYKFSKDEEVRSKEMKALEDERLATEARRKEQDAMKDARRREIEARRKEIEAKRAKKMTDSFLDALAADVAGR